MTPATIGPSRPQCPVCGKVSYSRDGIHPQCAVSRADAKLRVPREVQKEEAKPGRFSKRCGGCGRTVAARRMVCDCGRKFAAAAGVSQARARSS